VVRHWRPATSTFGPAVIRLLAAPALATLGDPPPETAPGLILSDVWDPDIVSPILGNLPLVESCPVMAGTAGFSRDVGAILMANILQVTAAVFIPDGLAVSATVSQGNSVINRVLFLPELAHMPVGHCWPVDGLTLQEITDSIAPVQQCVLHVLRCCASQPLSFKHSPVQSWPIQTTFR
jgi:hypothetical protein